MMLVTEETAQAKEANCFDFSANTELLTKIRDEQSKIDVVRLHIPDVA
jgi:hypothetical protein